MDSSEQAPSFSAQSSQVDENEHDIETAAVRDCFEDLLGILNSPHASMLTVDYPASQSSNTTTTFSIPARPNRPTRSTQAHTMTQENDASRARQRPRGPVLRDPRNPQVIEQRSRQGQDQVQTSPVRRNPVRAHRATQNGVSMNHMPAQEQIQEQVNAGTPHTQTVQANLQYQQTGSVIQQIPGQGLINGGQYHPLQPNWQTRRRLVVEQRQRRWQQQQQLHQYIRPNRANHQSAQPVSQNQQNGLAMQSMLNNQGMMNGDYHHLRQINGQMNGYTNGHANGHTNGQIQQNGYLMQQQQGRPGQYYHLNGSQPQQPVGVLGEPRCRGCGVTTTRVAGFDLFMCSCYAHLPPSGGVD